jgi:NIMA (never in mitosis gene a)-related kinase
LKKAKIVDGLTDKERKNALNEVRILASIENPYIIKYHEAFVDSSISSGTMQHGSVKIPFLCIIMEFVDGGDLYQKIQRFKSEGKKIKEDEVWRIAIQVIAGLNALHKMNIIH